MNPILPRKFFTPDVEAHVMPDGRLYLYGSNDLSGNPAYCSKEYRVYSTSDPKLERFADHGVSFTNTAEGAGLPYHPDMDIYAPDAIEKNGKYYLYICGQDGSEAVATADHPEGPFGKAERIEGIGGIDPAIFVDDDGQAYYLWGQFFLNGAKLAPDMKSIVPGSTVKNLLTEQEHGFHEGSSLRKINGRYYIVYTDISGGRATALSYAVADAPLGPYRKGGVIIDNVGCDPETWNNHGSIERFGGRLFVFYHRSSQNSRYSRRVCAEPLVMHDDGTIERTQMTCNGASDPIDAYATIDASIACRMRGNCYIAPEKKNPENEILTNCGGGNWTADWAEYRTLDFGEGAQGCTFRASGIGKIRVMAEGQGKLGEVSVRSKKKWTEVTLSLSEPITGKKAVWILFDGKKMQLDIFRFTK